MRLGLVLLGARARSFTCLSTGSSSLSLSMAGWCGPGKVERTQVLGAGVGSASSQLGVSKQVTSLLWLQFSKLKNRVTLMSALDE